jgi:putative transcriptional regulator
MHQEDIKAALRKEGVTMTALADAIDMNHAYVNAVINGKLRSAKVESAVAKVIGLPVGEVFPPKPPKTDTAARAAARAADNAARVRKLLGKMAA